MANIMNQHWKDQSTCDWEFLNGCFPRGCKVGDADGMMELGGKFLVLELKTRNGKVSNGMKLQWERLVKLCDFTVIIFWGEVKNNELLSVSRIQVLHRKNDRVCQTEIISASIESLINIVSDWASYAVKCGYPDIERDMSSGYDVKFGG